MRKIKEIKLGEWFEKNLLYSVYITISHTSKVMLKILQTRLQQSWTSIHSSSGTLSDLLSCINLPLPLYNHKGLWSSGFPYFLPFKSEFGNKEFMIWATVSSWFCFCWLFGASPSLAAENIIILFSVLTIWWCRCVESSLVLLEEGVCYDLCVLLTKLLAFALFNSVFQGQVCLLLQVFLDFLLLHSSPV